MNQYIITEEKLAEIESTPNEDTKDWLRIFYGLCDGVRSHPYQSERDKVLDELVAYKKRILLRENDEPNMRKRDFYEGLRRGINYAIELLELRQKAGEQCGDNCKGECSGEVTGTPFCPQSERDTVLDETSNGVVLWSPAHIFRLICRLDETELEYLLSDIRWLQERNFKRNHPELRQVNHDLLS